MLPNDHIFVKLTRKYYSIQLIRNEVIIAAICKKPSLFSKQFNAISALIKREFNKIQTFGLNFR